MISRLIFGFCMFAAASAAMEQCMKNPYAHYFKFGEISGVVTSDGPAVVGMNYFSVPDEAVTRSFEQVYRTTGPIVWQQNIAVLESPMGRMLVDTGSFNTGLPPFAQAGKLMPNLEAIGIEPKSIKHVLLTHGHPDHVAGLVNEDGEKAFPEAMVYVTDVEHKFWTADPFVNPNPNVSNATLNKFASIYVKSMNPYEKTGSLTLVKDGESPLENVKYILYPGHTPGHAAIEIESKGERLTCVGDIWFSQPDQVRNPEWTRPVETDGLMGYKSRVAVMKKASMRRDLILAFHEEFPGLGHITKTANSFDWIPAKSQNLGTVEMRC